LLGPCGGLVQSTASTDDAGGTGKGLDGLVTVTRTTATIAGIRSSVDNVIVKLSSISKTAKSTVTRTRIYNVMTSSSCVHLVVRSAGASDHPELAGSLVGCVGHESDYNPVITLMITV